MLNKCILAGVMNASPYLHHIIKSTLVAALLFICTIATAQSNQDSLIKQLRKINDLDSSETYARQLIRSAQKNNDKLFEARIWYAQSFKIYSSGDEVKALAYARKSASLTSPADSVTYTNSATMIAYMLVRRGKSVEALNTAFDILKKTEDHGWVRQSIDCRNCIADIYRTINVPQKALPYGERAAKDALRIKDTSLYVFSLSTLSNVLSAKDMQTPANLQKATKYMEIILNKPYVATISDFTKARYLSNLGRLYEMQAQYDKAEVVLKQSVAISRKNDYKGLLESALNELMTSKVDQKKYADAVIYGEEILGIINDKMSLTQQRGFYDHLTSAYAGVGNYEKAYKYLRKENTVYDSLMAIEKIGAAAELDEKYKKDKKLLQAAQETWRVEQQRNYIIILAVIIVLAIVFAYRWFAYKRKKEADILAEQHRQLAKLDAMKTRFFANISHELRTPLTLIMGPMEQLINNPSLNNTAQSNNLQTIWRNSKKLLSMVNELLDLGKMEAGGLALKPQPVSLSSFVTVLYQGFASIAEYKKINYQLVTHIDRDVVAQLDRDKFEKIANNLLSNAIKFTPPNGLITVTGSIDNNMICFKVTDTGSGINPDDLPYVFDRYFQGNADGEMAEGGTGIGLAIAKEFAVLMQGKIAAESTPGKGSAFEVRIPLIIANEVQVAEPTTSEIMNPASEAAQHDEKQLVLLVEDHMEMVDYIATILQPRYNIIKAIDGEEALQKLADLSSLPQLIISDVMMPGMDGFTLLTKLKAHQRYCRIPVIMLTALADTPSKLKALHIGVDDYITKPFIGNELITRASNLITNAAERTKVYQEMPAVTATEDMEVVEESMAEPSPADLNWLTEVEAQVRKYAGKTDFNIASLSYEMAISERQLFRRIKSITGLTPNKYIRTIRLQIAREAIESGKYRTIAEVSYAAGFETPAYFSKLFKEHYGREITDFL